MTKGSRPDQWGASPVRAALTRKSTPLSFAIRLFLGSLFILFLSIILFAKRGCSPRRCPFSVEVLISICLICTLNERLLSK